MTTKRFHLPEWAPRHPGLDLYLEPLNPGGPNPVLLDLCCGAGGAALGYFRAGFDIIGCDNEAQPRYPFRFVRCDWREALEIFGPIADAVHISPPCQRWSKARWGHLDHPDEITPFRAVIGAYGVPYVIENVQGAPLHSPVRLCGTGFGQAIIRHRYFETSFPVSEPPACRHEEVRREQGELLNLFGPALGAGYVRRWRQVVDIPWMTVDELTEAISPAYTEWVGIELMKHIDRRDHAEME